MDFQNSPQIRALDQTTHENGGLVLHHSMQHDCLHEWICESENIISWFWCQSKCETRAIKLNKCPIMNFKGLLWIGLLISRCFSTSCQWPFTTSRPWIDITCFWSIFFNWLSFPLGSLTINIEGHLPCLTETCAWCLGFVGSIRVSKQNAILCWFRSSFLHRRI